MLFVRQEIDTFESSNITQLYNDWNPSTTYIYEELSVVTNSSVVRYNGYYWRSLVASNVGNNPEETEGTKWFKWKVSNANAMLDHKSNTTTVNEAGDIIVEFLRGNVDSLGLGYLDASGVTIEHYTYGTDGTDGVLIPEATNTTEYTVNDTVFDLWSYVYDEYTNAISRGLFIPVPPIGYKIKVTIHQSTITNRAACGFMIAGEANDMGCTNDSVSFKFNSFSSSEPDTFGNLNIIKRSIQDLVDFNTTVDKGDTARVRRKIKAVYDDIVMFVVDESDDSVFESAITLGKIINASVVAEYATKNHISWSIMESI